MEINSLRFAVFATPSKRENDLTARFSLYVSPYLVAGQGGKYTKHIYIGSQRIVSIRWFKWSYLDSFFLE